MGEMMTAVYALLGFILVASVIAIETKDLLSSVISVSAAGAALAIIFLLLGAPDLAFTQVVVEVIFMVLLIRATVRHDDTTVESHRDMFSVASGLVFVGVLVLVSVFAFRSMTPFGQPLMTLSQPYLSRSFTDTGAANAVTGVLLDFRAYDTLGEATVIFTAVIGAFAVLRHLGRKRAAEKGPRAGEEAP